MRDLAVVLASGGMDSCVATAMAAAEHRLAMLHVSYGQRTEGRELRAFHAIADHYHAEHRLAVSLPHFATLGGSSLTDRAIPVSRAQPSPRGIPTSYVPFRNGTMLAVAVSWAEVLQARAVYVGAVEEDSSGYPDCRREFFDAFAAAVRAGTRPTTSIAIETPVIGMTKAEIVGKAFALDAPLQLTWSCYQREDVACGVCDSCALRLRGFQEAGREDPIPYAVRPSYLRT